MTKQESQQKDDVSRSPWDDPSVPAGSSPPLPAWPAWVTGAIWVCWVGFMMVTAFG